MAKLSFSKISRINKQRCNAWHPNGLDHWSVSDWSNAMAGEAGEICNAVKKLRRLEDKLPSKNDRGRNLKNRQQAVAKIGEELADTFLYLDLLASKLGIDLPEEIVKKFNKVSDKYGFPQKL